MEAAGYAPPSLVALLWRAPAHALMRGVSLRGRLVLFPLLWLLMLAGGASASTPAVPITSCTNITQPGYYYLESDIINASTDASSGCINIFASDVVLDGRGHVIEGTEGAEGAGLYAYNVSRLRIKNLSIRGFMAGIMFSRVSSSLIESSTISGIRMYGVGIVLESSSGNTLSENNISGNPWGVVLGASSGNSISDNIISGNNQWGVWLAEGSSSNIISGNTITGNWGGVLLFFFAASNNTLSGNIISGNRVGVLIDSNNSLIYNNLFNNTQNVQFAFSSPYYSNAWNTTKRAGTNIVGGSYIGGNYWGSPSGDGYSDTCTDSDGDGICDSPYVLSNETASEIDYLPLTTPVGMPEFQGYAALTVLVPWVGYLLRRRAG